MFFSEIAKSEFFDLGMCQTRKLESEKLRINLKPIKYFTRFPTPSFRSLILVQSEDSNSRQSETKMEFSYCLI